MSKVSRLLKKAHLLRCTQSPRYDVAPKYASARRFLVRLASETFLNSLEFEFSTSVKIRPRFPPERDYAATVSRGATFVSPTASLRHCGARSSRAHPRRSPLRQAPC